MQPAGAGELWPQAEGMGNSRLPLHDDGKDNLERALTATIHEAAVESSLSMLSPKGHTSHPATE